jgi:hypothetical protein
LKHHASPDFWGCYRSLPEEVQRLADRAYEHLKRDPRHPSLQFKKVGRFWSARIGATYRALGIEASEGVIWFWIGRHAEYDKLIR